ncbi:MULTISPECIES: 3-keto-5-aminohexanoate cleavage protein [Pacificibacter]|uniref:3-keto-5-aminohexanoate cleavage protein n=1 Tax=Pacificibacter TaxID=1042323 RepID=UPI001C088368|nr:MULTISPECIES: 3-keto-5-aminohexanoate cleavage protein [Pacificibacter]MBU2935548.1 3-keto-5-aminohexanoate cleavage protein [Pacificibacter marinus]MDO6614045.1 3-keto-5-aminohexanoate cleavage protein [Pacificibacter sp. 1_MG-2023]
MKPLPNVMVAPNGARKTKADHPALPVTVSEMVTTAVACYAAGADGLHLHVRNETGGHSLDVGLYQEALTALKIAVPDMTLQITTEAVGMYSPAQQRNVVERIKPDAVSISIAEMCADDDKGAVRAFYAFCADQGIAVQHILYGENDLKLMGTLFTQGILTPENLQLLFVLGRYTAGQQSDPQDLTPFVSWKDQHCPDADWGICAFGQNETKCLRTAQALGGKMRVGFENSFQNADGSIAKNNVDRVAEIVNGPV